MGKGQSILQRYIHFQSHRDMICVIEKLLFNFVLALKLLFISGYPSDLW